MHHNGMPQRQKEKSKRSKEESTSKKHKGGLKKKTPQAIRMPRAVTDSKKLKKRPENKKNSKGANK